MENKVRYIRKPELISKTGLGATTIYNLEKRGEFPQHFMLAPRCAVWDEGQVERWMERRRAENNAPSNFPDVTKSKRFKESKKTKVVVDEDFLRNDLDSFHLAFLRKVADDIDDTIAPTSDEHFWIFSTEQLIEFVEKIRAE